MKRLVREFQFNEEEERRIGALAKELKITPVTAGILYARGNDTAEKMRAFLNPSREHFLSPFLMSGMQEARDLIFRARDEEWRVAVFGDYDADGIGASAILYRALTRLGIQPYLYVPERTEGYGMSVEAIDKIFDEFLPDLIITVDCGISNRKEVKYIQEQGAYVIVTDHHELPDELPECITVNPKFKDDYPYDNLCGAGVAFKLATALIGDEALSLLDFAALSTVADSVPLLGENRDIVAEGLKLIERAPRPAIAALIGKPGDISAQTLAFTVAPRINAAGRMGDAHAALLMFTSEDEEEIARLAEQLNAYNVSRQKYCDEIYQRALKQIYAEGAYGNVVMLAGENWNAGTVGIVAARLAEQFNRPALLFVKHGGLLRGSARSIESVNIFEALKACSGLIEEFGGHSQAAGVNVKEENFAALKEALNAYLGAHYTPEDFAPSVPVCGIAEDFERVAREVERLEPFGVGNRRPQFILEADETNAALMKPLSPHVSVTSGPLELVGFNLSPSLKLLRSDLKKQIVFDYNISTFRGKEYIKGFMRTLVYDGRSGEEVGLDLFANRLLAYGSRAIPAVLCGREELNGLIASSLASCAYGLCAVCWNREALKDFPALEGLPVEVFRLSSGSVGNAVLVAPDEGCDLSAYREVIFLDGPAAGVETGEAKVYLCEGNFPLGLDCSREGLLQIFTALRAEEGQPAGGSYADAARRFAGLDIPPRQLAFAFAVFEELGLLTRESGSLRFVRGKKTELKSSAVYSAVAAAEEG